MRCDIISSDTVYTINFEDAVNKLSETDYGIHCLIVYPDLTTLREFYKYYIKRQLDEKNEYILFAPFYETPDTVRQIFSSGYQVIDIDKYEKHIKSLAIVDSVKKYFVDNNDAESTDDFGIDEDVNKNTKLRDMTKFVNTLVKNIHDQGKSGVSSLCDTACFYYKADAQLLIKYERSLPIKFDIDFKGMCLYHQKDFARFSEKQQKQLIQYHGLVLKIIPY